MLRIKKHQYHSQELKMKPCHTFNPIMMNLNKRIKPPDLRINNQPTLSQSIRTSKRKNSLII